MSIVLSLLVLLSVGAVTTWLTGHGIVCGICIAMCGVCIFFAMSYEGGLISRIQKLEKNYDELLKRKEGEKQHENC